MAALVVPKINMHGGITAGWVCTATVEHGRQTDKNNALALFGYYTVLPPLTPPPLSSSSRFLRLFFPPSNSPIASLILLNLLFFPAADPSPTGISWTFRSASVSSAGCLNKPSSSVRLCLLACEFRPRLNR